MKKSKELKIFQNNSKTRQISSYFNHFSKNSGLQSPGILILCGPSGCGKTHTAHHFSSRMDFKTFVVGELANQNPMQFLSRCVLYKKGHVILLKNPQEILPDGLLEDLALIATIPFVVEIESPEGLNPKSFLKTIFKGDFLDNPKVTTVVLNPPAERTIRKALRAVLGRKPKIADDFLDGISKNCGRNFRKAISMAKNRSDGILSRNDESFGLFHSIGKILHMKLEESPEEIFEKVSKSALISASDFVDYIQHNAIGFVAKFEDIVAISYCFSDCDLFGGNGPKSAAGDYRLTIAARGYTVNNTELISKWSPISKPPTKRRKVCDFEDKLLFN